MREDNREAMRNEAKRRGLKYVAKYAGHIYSADGENGPYFKWDIFDYKFVPFSVLHCPHKM